MKCWVGFVWLICVLLVACAPSGSTATVPSTETSSSGDSSSTISAAIGSITLVSGTVTINGKAAKEGNELHEGDLIATKADSKANLEFLDGAILRLDANTEVTLTEITKDHVKINQASGQTYTRLLKLAGVTEYDVETADVTASVRGTGFKVSIVDDTTEVAVGEGEVEVSTRKEGRVMAKQMIRKSERVMMRRAALETIKAKSMTTDTFMKDNEKADDEFIDRMVTRFANRHPRIVAALKEAGYTKETMHDWMRNLATGNMTKEEMKMMVKDEMIDLRQENIQAREQQTSQ